MARGYKTGGRKKGTPNKTTMEVKAALLEAFDDLGGVESLVAWATENPTEFYKLWAKVMPVQMTESTDSREPIDIRITRATKTND